MRHSLCGLSVSLVIMPHAFSDSSDAVQGFSPAPIVVRVSEMSSDVERPTPSAFPSLESCRACAMYSVALTLQDGIPISAWWTQMEATRTLNLHASYQFTGFLIPSFALSSCQRCEEPENVSYYGLRPLILDSCETGLCNLIVGRNESG